MAVSGIDLLAKRRIFGRFLASASASAAASKALAHGRSVAVWDDQGQLCRQHANGRREPIEPEGDNDASKKP